MKTLKEQFHTSIVKELKDELGIENVMAIPHLKKIIVNAGIGKLLQRDAKQIDTLVESMREITGQQPVRTRAKKAISSFKIREGQVVGLAVTLRGKRMYDFFEKLTRVALPRTRDFRGLSKKGFDGKGNYTLGIKEHIVFPEMAGEDVSSTFGLEITIVTSAEDDKAGYILLKKMGFPFND